MCTDNGAAVDRVTATTNPRRLTLKIMLFAPVRTLTPPNVTRSTARPLIRVNSRHKCETEALTCLRSKAATLSGETAPALASARGLAEKLSSLHDHKFNLRLLELRMSIKKPLSES